MSEKVLMAVIGAPHGVRGEVRVKTFTGDPLALGDYGPLFDAAGKSYTILDLRPSKTVVVAKIKEVPTREAAEAANGTELFVARAALPDDLDEDEFYQTDLIGLSAVDEAGACSIRNGVGGGVGHRPIMPGCTPCSTAWSRSSPRPPPTCRRTSGRR